MFMLCAVLVIAAAGWVGNRTTPSPVDSALDTAPPGQALVGQERTGIDPRAPAVALPVAPATGGDGSAAASEPAASPSSTPPATRTSEEGFVVLEGASPVVGSGTPVRFTVEVAEGAADIVAVGAKAEEALLDTEHGWAATGEFSLGRIADPAAADVRVVVAPPATVDAWCGRAGLQTEGIYSCWDGVHAMLNAERWSAGAATFGGDLEAYRGYLVSHEVGHGLGRGHVGCPGPGEPAPVMMQQTIDVGACLANPYPWPPATPAPAAAAPAEPAPAASADPALEAAASAGPSPAPNPGRAPQL